MEEITNLFTSLGFPMGCVICLGLFIFKIYQATVEDKKALMEANAKREERLEDEIKENRKIVSKSVETLALYADRLQGIESDVDTIKGNISIIKEKIK